MSKMLKLLSKNLEKYAGSVIKVPVCQTRCPNAITVSSITEKPYLYVVN